jgi:hypothetical protein
MFSLAKKSAVVVSLLSLTFILTGYNGCTRAHYEGATIGGAVGGIAGAIIDKRNPWRGGIIGAAIGAIAGATIADISLHGSREVVRTGRPVEYRTEDGRGIYRAEPYSEVYSPDGHTTCRKVHERVWEDGQLVKDSIREVCESIRHERRY